MVRECVHCKWACCVNCECACWANCIFSEIFQVAWMYALRMDTLRECMNCECARCVHAFNYYDLWMCMLGELRFQWDFPSCLNVWATNGHIAWMHELRIYMWRECINCNIHITWMHNMLIYSLNVHVAWIQICMVVARVDAFIKIFHVAWMQELRMCTLRECILLLLCALNVHVSWTHTHV